MVSNLNKKGLIKYKKPNFVIIHGLPGSGKTTLSKEVSKKLKFFNLSNDYIRNYYYNTTKEDKSAFVTKLNIQRKVKIENIIRLLNLLINRISIVMDKDCSDKSEFEKYEKVCKLLRYRLIKIYIISNDDQENIKRISERVYDFNKIDEEIIGDNCMYSTSYSEEDYFNIKERKKENIEGVDFDYTIINEGTKEEYLKQIDKLIYSIKDEIK